MGRPRTFDRATALARAIRVFAGHGFEGASTETLLESMGIGRQSLYDTFGDKRRLYLEALARYSADSTAELIGAMREQASALKGLETALVLMATRPAATPEDGCLGVGAVCEFGRSDPEVAAINDAAGATLLGALEGVIRHGQAAAEIAAALDAHAAAEFLAVTLSGLKLAARAGGTPESLRGVVKVALRSLT